MVDIRGLSACYGDFQALFDMTCEVGEGETIAIIGANGAGKSTFLKAIAGVVPAPSEAILFDGKPIGGLRSMELVARGIALVPEGRCLFASLSVEENLLMGAYAKRPGEWSLAKVYGVFPRLRERRHQSATTLSGGEQQMVAIGRALMSNPRLLMCDEISLGLAPSVIANIYQALGPLKGRHMAMLIVEQDIHQAVSFSDRLYCFQEGRVSLTGQSTAVTHAQISSAYFGA
ncbi:MAG: ABC transporter ATP-binding protein [Proteobacteria bacterium]|nr:ABC transporter ATP-binding protein [Pseudomonadota bacterium]